MTERTYSEVKQELLTYQNPLFAIIGGLSIAILCAILWAIITMAFEYQIGLMSIVIGVVVGLSVRFYGQGIDPVYGIIGGFLAIFSCSLGNLLSQLGFAAMAENLNFIEVVSYLNLSLIIEIFLESFDIMDLVFYGIALIEGIKFGMRPFVDKSEYGNNLEPEHEQYRKPLAMISSLFVLICLIALLTSGSNYKEFKYPNGNLMSEGEIIEGYENGDWKYYYEDGTLQSTVNFKDGLEIGVAEVYYNNGQISEQINYENGSMNGISKSFYESGNVREILNYKNGRLNGAYYSFYESGDTSQKGTYNRDEFDDVWTSFYENGQISTKGAFVNGVQLGIWKLWNEKGDLLEKNLFEKNDVLKFILLKDNDLNVLVENGNGNYKSFYDNGNVMLDGLVADSLRVGLWKEYYSNGFVSSVVKYFDNRAYTKEVRNENNDIEVENGYGSFTTFYENSLMSSSYGTYKNGSKSGIWEFYNLDPHVLISAMNYKKDKLHGKYLGYFLSGNKHYEGQFDKDKKVGLWVWYYDNGVLETEANFIDDKKEGEQNFYSQSGILLRTEVYENGELISEEVNY